MQREGVELDGSLSLLASLTEGLSAGQLRAFVEQLAERMQGGAAVLAGSGAAAGACQVQGGGAAAGPAMAGCKAQQGHVLSEPEELALQLLPAFAPVKAEEAQALREWTARAHSALPPEVRRGVAPGQALGLHMLTALPPCLLLYGP